MSNWSLVITIANRGSGEKISRTAVAAGAGGGTILLGRGTAPNAVLHFLGLGDSAKDVVVNLAEDGCAAGVRNAIIEFSKESRMPGIIFGGEAECLARSGFDGATEWRNQRMNDNIEEMAIVAIVNRDYAEDALAAARKAGAHGGTILEGRGTASESDAAFFGVKLVPEKDVLVIVAGSDIAEQIVEAIRAAPCFAEKGSGIVFAVKASHFALLGKR